MAYTLPPDRRVRLEVWTDYPFATVPGTRVDFLPRRDLVHLSLPRGTDRAQQATIELVPSARVVAAATARRVLRVVPFAADGTAGAPVYFRLHTDELVLGPGQAQFRVTAAQPLLDWGGRRMRLVSSGGLTSFVFGGFYTPTEALTLLLASLTARGRGEWSLGTVTRTDARQIDWTAQTELEALDAIATAWESEVQVRCVGDAGFVVDLLSRVGTNTPPVLRLGGALVSLTRSRDASALATAVLPLGAGGAMLGLDAWTVTSVTAGSGSTGVIGLADGNGGYGPVQQDGQLVGAYLQKPDGTRTVITATLANDGVTSLVTVASRTGLAVATTTTPADVAEFRADAAGTRLVAVQAPQSVRTLLGEVEVPLERTDLTAARNYVPNPRGRDYNTTSTPPAGWAYTATGSATIARLTGGYPAACPIGDPGFVWRWVTTRNGQVLTCPLAPAIDPVLGDNRLAVALTCYVDFDLHDVDDGLGNITHQPKLQIQLRDAGGVGIPGASAVAGQTDGQTWLTLGANGVSLLALAQCYLEITFAGGGISPAGGGPIGPYGVTDIFGGIPVYVAGVQLTRGASPTATAATFVEGAPVNQLRQAANAHLAGHLMPLAHYEATASDRSEVDARYSDQALVDGGDVIVRATDYGISDRVRLLSRPVDPTAPGAPTPLTLVAAPDPALAALIGATSPGRERTASDYIQDALAATPSAAETPSTTTIVTSGGLTSSTVGVGARFDVTDPTFGAVGDGVTNATAAFQAAHDAALAAGGGRVVIPAGRFIVNGVKSRTGITWEWLTSNSWCALPATAGNGARAFTTDGVEWGGSEDSPGVIAFINPQIDGQRALRGAYGSFQQEQSNLITVAGDITQAGRVRVEISGGRMIESVGDGISVGPNVDLLITGVQTDNCFRGGVTIYGGNTKVRGGNFRHTGAVENYGLHVEIDQPGYGGSYVADVMLATVQSETCRCTLGVVPGTVGSRILVDKLTAGVGSIFSGADAAVRVTNSQIIMGEESTTISRIVNPFDMVFDNVEFVCRGATSLIGAHVFFGVAGYTTPQTVTLRNCAFTVEPGSTGATTKVAVLAEPQYLADGHRVIVEGGSISDDFDVGVQLREGGTAVVRNVQNQAATPVWASAGTGLEYDLLLDNPSVGGSATKWAHLEVATSACTLRHRNCLVDAALAGISTTYGYGSLTSLGERTVLAAAAPGSAPGIRGDRWRLETPVSGATYEWVATTTSTGAPPGAATWKAAVALA